MNKLFAELMEKKPVATAATDPSPTESSTPVSSPLQTTSAPLVSSIEEKETLASVVRQEPPKEKESAKPKGIQSTSESTQDATSIAILHLTKEETAELRETAYKNQTFRFSEDELNWLRDRSYGLTRAMGKKVGQNDLLRLGLKVFRKLVADKQKVLEEILESII